MRAEQGAAGLGQGGPHHAGRRSLRAAVGGPGDRHVAGLEAAPRHPTGDRLHRRQSRALRGDGRRGRLRDGPRHRPEHRLGAAQARDRRGGTGARDPHHPPGYGQPPGHSPDRGAAGRGLEGTGGKVGKRGIEIDERMRTSVPSIYAGGDLAGRYLFTHSAGYEAVRALRDAFYPGKGKVTDFVPWCTFTDPELAHAGLTTAEAEAKHGDDVEVYRMELRHSDRARADGASEGCIVVVTAKGKLVGAHILAPSAGEMIHELAMGISEGMKLNELASLIHVYPTLSTSIGQLAADAAFEGAKRLRWLVRKEK